MSDPAGRKPIDRIFPFRGLPAPVYVLFIARIINRMGDFVRTFLALYLTRILGMPATQAGMVVTASAVAGMVGTLVSGRITDRLGRKRTMLTAQSLSATILLACGFSPDAAWLPYALIASQFFFGAIRPASQALLTDLTPVEDRRKAFGLLYFGINIGVAIGSTIAGFLFRNHRQLIFWGDGLTTLLGVLLVALLVREPAAENVHRGDSREDEDSSHSVRAFFSRPILVGFLLAMAVAHFIYAQVHFSVPLLMDRLFGVDGARNLGFLMSANAVTVLIFTPLLLGLFGQERPGRNMVWGALAYALGFGCLALIPGSMAWVLVSMVVWTLGEIIFATNTRVFSAAYTPVNHRGRFASIEQTAKGAGEFLSPVSVGFLTVVLGPRGIWYPIFGLSIVLMLAMAILDRKDRESVIRTEESGTDQKDTA